MGPWDLYFAQLVAWRLHPGYLRDGAKPLSIEECAKLADEMFSVRQERMLWRSEQLSQAD